MVDDFDTFISITQYGDISISLYTRTAIDLNFGTYPKWWMREPGTIYSVALIHERSWEKQTVRKQDTTHKQIAIPS